MSSIVETITSVISFIKTLFDFLPEYSEDADKQRVEKAERFLYLIQKILMSLIDLISHLSFNSRRISDFLEVTERGEKTRLKEAVAGLFPIFPLPGIVELPEDDVFSLALNLVTKDTRDFIAISNTIAENLKRDPTNVTLLSQLWVYLSLLRTGMFGDFERLVRFQVEYVNKIMGNKVDTNETEKRVQKALENLRGLAAVHEQLSEEIAKTSSEIKQKIAG